VIVRDVAAADLDACAALFQQVAAEGRWIATELPIDRRELIAGWRDLMRTRDGAFFLAEEAGNVVGLAALVGRRAPELAMLVAAAHRGRGIGGLLLDACVAWARDARAAKVMLRVFPHNARAIALYRSHGFAETGVEPAAVPRRGGGRWDAIRMELDLARG
jgi:RimJ/RimL family protein N-acetyltransferase